MRFTERTGRKTKPGRAGLLALTLLVAGSLFAQEGGAGRQRIAGQVLEGEEGISDVHVMNLSARMATISDAEGYFGIGAAPGDTLLFSAVRYRRKTLVIDAGMLRAVSLLVPLEPFVNELDEVVVSPFDLSGDLDRDMERLPEDQTVTAYSLGLPNAYAPRRTNTEKILNEATTGGGIVPLNPILNYISGRTRRLKKQLAYEREYEKSRNMRAQFTDSLFVSELKVPLERIPDFMYFCEVDPVFGEVADSGDRLRIWAFLRRKSSEYRRFNELD